METRVHDPDFSWRAARVRTLWERLAAGHNVRGALVGRNVLYPGDQDPLAMAEAVGGIVHEQWSVETALQSMAANRGRDMDTRTPASQSRFVA